MAKQFGNYPRSSRCPTDSSLSKTGPERGSWSTSKEGQRIDTMASRSVSGIGREKRAKRKCGGEDTSNVS